jgi:hypothetical protein
MIVILSSSISRGPAKYRWTGVTADGELTGGWGETKRACRDEANNLRVVSGYFCEEAPEEPIEFCGGCGGVMGIPDGQYKCVCKQGGKK